MTETFRRPVPRRVSPRHLRVRPWQVEGPAVPLSEASRTERIVHYVLAAILVGLLVVEVSDWLRRPHLVHDSTPYTALLNDVAAGEATVIDDSGDGYVLWQTRDGTTYAARRRARDLRRTIAAQPAIRRDPDAVRFGRIDAPPVDSDNRRRWRETIYFLGALLLVAAGPEPRHATRWAWFWIARTGFGLLAFLLLGGSRLRTTGEDDDEEERRVTGPQAFGALLLLVLAWSFVANFWLAPDDRRGEPLRRDAVPPVGRLDPQDHGP